MPTRILMASQLSDAVMDVAREILPSGYELIVAEFDSAEFAAALKDAEYYVGSPRFPLGPEFYRAAPRLKLVQLFSAGYDRLDLAAARAAGVPICNNGGSNSVAVAEHALLLMLAVSRRVVWEQERRRRPRARQRFLREPCLRARRQGARHRRSREYRQEGGAPRQCLPYARPVLRHCAAERRRRGCARRAFRALP